MKEANLFLQNNNIAVIATTYKNIPFAAAVHYVVDSDFNFYFITSRNSDKYLNVVINPNIALVVGDGPKHISVQARGHAHILGEKEKPAAGKKIFTMIKKSGVKKWPARDMKRFHSDGTVLTTEIIIKVVPQHLTFMNLDDKNYPKSLGNQYHTILPKKSTKK
jgi:nitroimidazol reductase NimA-like FMN-containing flavoprotein (pyridoxamine 5'-phosphate oxidase superfamily)